MDDLEFELMEPLSYGGLDEEEEVDVIKNGRKRGSGTCDVEAPVERSSKRQRVKSPGITIEEIIDDVPSESTENEVQSDTHTTQFSKKSSKRHRTRSPGITIEEITDDIPSDNKENQAQFDTTQFSKAGKGVTVTEDPVINVNELVDDGVVNVKFRRVLKRIPHDVPYLPLTCEDGSRLYLRIKEPAQDTENDSSLMSAKSNRNLINNWDQVKAEARILKDKFHSELAKTVENGLGPTTCDDNKENIGLSTSDCLWVEKYKPRSFLDLLSQEAVNTALLHWIKMWDKSVFGVDYLAKVKATRQKYSKLEAEEKEKDEKFHRKSYLPTSEDYDEGGRPLLKVALLSGDPGLGKTTCAHIIAKHAGYNIRELNASDDRSIEVFRKVLDDTTQSRSEIFQDGRPNCLVIDEIDGAPLASVNVLVELMTGNATESGKKKAKKVLRRPIICICNDLYASSLKILKKHAFVVQFPTVSIPRLVERLNYVTEKEKLHLDTNTIQSLCQKSECDIRSCLSTLQFLKLKRYTSKDAIFAQVGIKDKSKGIFTVWGDIFTLPPEKRYQDAHLDPSKSDMRFRNILTVVQNFGEYDKLLGGVLENYLNVRYRDSYLQSVIEGLEWTTWFEDIRGYIERTQTYGMYGYMPLYFVMSHFLFARKNPMRIQFPSQELMSKAPKFQQAIKTQISETAPSAARFLDPYMLITDIFPAVLNIIQPSNIRPVPTQIWTQRERETLRNVVEVMLTYNLCYTQAKNPETGAYFFQLEPDLEDLVKFKLQDSSISKKPFPYAIKQLVAREIETEKLRRNDMIPEIVQKETFKFPETPKASTPKSKALEAFTKNPICVPRDFFGRPIVVVEKPRECETKKEGAAPVYFRFKEGYSNAVRRYVKMRDLC